MEEPRPETKQARVCADCKAAPPRSARAVYCVACAPKSDSSRRRGKRPIGAPPLSGTESAKYQRKGRARWASRQSERSHWRNLKSKYGISEEEYAAIIAAQGGVCAICERPPSAFTKRFATDHLHSAAFIAAHGKAASVRGALCWRDNYHLVRKGVTPADLRRAADYLERWPARSVVVTDAPMPLSDGDYRDGQKAARFGFIDDVKKAA